MDIQTLSIDLQNQIFTLLADTLSVAPINRTEFNNLLEQTPDLQETNHISNDQVSAIISLAKYASADSNSAAPYMDIIVVKLLGYLEIIPKLKFSNSLIRFEHIPAELLGYKVTLSLIAIGQRHSSFSDEINHKIWRYLCALPAYFSSDKPERVCSVIIPYLLGILRACTDWHLKHDTTPFDESQAAKLVDVAGLLLNQSNLALIRDAVTKGLEKSSFVKNLIIHYPHSPGPISANFIIYLYLKFIKQFLLSYSSIDQVMQDSSCSFSRGSMSTKFSELKAGNRDGTLCKFLKAGYVMAMQYVNEFKVIRTMQTMNESHEGYAMELYCPEIIAECLEIALLCQLHLNTFDDQLYNNLRSIVESPPVFHVPAFDDNKIYASAFNCCIALLINFPEKSEVLMELLYQPLLNPPESLILREEMSRNYSKIVQRFRELLLNAFGQCVNFLHMYYDQNNTLSIISSLLNKLYALSEEHDKKHSVNEKLHLIVSRNIIMAISAVTVKVNSHEVNQFSISLLSRRLGNPVSALDATITQKLVEIALVSSQSLFVEVVKILAYITRKTSTPESTIYHAAFEAEKSLAQRIKIRPELYKSYLMNLLQLFADKGSFIKDSVNQNHGKLSSLAAELGSVIPLISSLLSHNDFPQDAFDDPQICDMLQSFWFLSVVFGLLSEPMWLEEWHSHFCIIASKSSMLVPSDSVRFLDTELDSNPILKDCPDDVASNVRTVITTHLPEHSYTLKYMAFPQLCFLLAVWHAVTMKAAYGNCTDIMAYLCSINSSHSLSPYLISIGEKAVDIFIKHESQKREPLQSTLESEFRKMLLFSCHRMSFVSEFSDKCTKKIVASYPLLLARRNLLRLLLELVNLLWKSCESCHIDEYNPCYTFKSKEANLVLELPDNYPYRRKLMEIMVSNAKNWITAALERSPNDVVVSLQAYLADFRSFHFDFIHAGRSLALKQGSAREAGLSGVDICSQFLETYGNFQYYRGFYLGGANSETGRGADLRLRLAHIIEAVKNSQEISLGELTESLHCAAVSIIQNSHCDYELIKLFVRVPAAVFTQECLSLASSVWSWVCVEKPKLETRLMMEISLCWKKAITEKKGIYSDQYVEENPISSKMQYEPSNRAAYIVTHQKAQRSFGAHLEWIKFLASRFESVRLRKVEITNVYVSLLHISFASPHKISKHPLAREAVFRLLALGLRLLQRSPMDFICEFKFRSVLYNRAFDWFSASPKWTAHSNSKLAKEELKLLKKFYEMVQADRDSMTSAQNSKPKSTAVRLVNAMENKTRSLLKDGEEGSINDTIQRLSKWRRLLLLFLESEITRLTVWLNPIIAMDDFIGATQRAMTNDAWKNVVRYAWELSSCLAYQLYQRYKSAALEAQLLELIYNDPANARHIPQALSLLVEQNPNVTSYQLKYLHYWAVVPPITSVAYFLHHHNGSPLLLQYAMRSLESHSPEVVFFCIPQIVQALRYDALGYVERYILRTANISPKFAHQIIWNMDANMYKDDECEVEDSLKPTLEKVRHDIIEQLSGEAKEFYEREFKFFNLVTGISGKLKPFIKKSKPEKKAKIDEELGKIQVDVGVYLPSNPDGEVIGIDYHSGRPLQSHAKAPYMATFKIRREIEELVGNPPVLFKRPKDLWLSAIFKVGDDCRQDVLALQLIAIFRSVYSSLGLDLWLFPYRVVATAPGCGVIDVIPNAISRDMLGREKINSLFDYFKIKYGPVDSLAFQKARNALIQSVAAYSVVSYLLQFKDRHNGNIMLDEQGHVIHIDFGFILDIAPGGVNFESSPFKLTTEMIEVMGGKVEMQPYVWFCELCIKAYLAIRTFAEPIMHMVALMLDSGLPCFKGETLKRLKQRFSLELNERDAALYMLGLIRESCENKRTVLYDAFQKATNGIPY